MKRINWVSVDIPKCKLLFSATNEHGTCPATGTPCFNTLATCKALASYQGETTKAFFTDPTMDLDVPVGSIYQNSLPIANIISLSYTPPIIDPGISLGTRGTLRITFADHPTSDLQQYEDPYVQGRDYNPWTKGTFWGKFLSRHRYMRGQVLKWAIVDPQTLDFSIDPPGTQIFIIDRIEGPGQSGTVTLIAKDPATIIDDKRAIAPTISRGSINAILTSGATSATLIPAGIGDDEYPASGYVAIGGKEICSFTRSGDVLTLTRAQYNTTAVQHEISSRAQVCQEYLNEDVADILYSLMVDYGRIPASYISLPTWKEETGSFLGRAYSALIAEPTNVKDMIDELITQAGLVLWWDGSQFRLQVLKNLPSTQDIDDEMVLPDSISKTEQPSKRISQVWIYFGLRNPLEDSQDPKNYELAQVTTTATAADLETLFDNVPSVKTIYGRWISKFQRTTAERINSIFLARFSTPPRMVEFTLMNVPQMAPPSMAQAINITSQQFQDAFGNQETIKCQVIESRRSAGTVSIRAEEMTLPVIPVDDPTQKVITIQTDVQNFNLRRAYESIFLVEPADGDTVICRIDEGVVVGSSSVSSPAFDVGTGWPSGSYDIRIELADGAYIVGRGGEGGGSRATDLPAAESGFSGANISASGGQNGGPALHTSISVDLVNEGVIGGGGGGGTGACSVIDFLSQQIFVTYRFKVVSLSTGGAGAGSIITTAKAPLFSGNSIATNLKTGEGTLGVSTAGRGFNASASYSNPGLFNPISASTSATAGKGGGLGQSGASGATSRAFSGGSLTNERLLSYSGGSPGNAIDGVSLCTITGGGQILGPTVN